jgi:hypothetical protein
MRIRGRHLSVVVVLFVCLAAALPARADEAAEEEDGGLGLSIELGLMSSYVFRGWNVFQEDEQMDPHLLLAPGVSWSIFDTGLTLGYWGAFQLTGDNIDANIDDAIGMEQDLYLTYELGLPYDLTFSAGLFAYLYPAADKAVAGATLPAFLEPQVGLGWSGVVDVSLTVAYLLGVQQDVDAIRDCSYFYVSPKVSKSFALASWVGLDVALSYGVKVFQEGNEGRDNVHDLQLTAAAPISLWGPFWLTPLVGVAWTNVEDAPGAPKDFGDGVVVWGGVTAGVSL